MLGKVEILSVPITKGTRGEILEEVRAWLSDDAFGRYIVTPNPEMLALAQKREDFKKALESSDLRLADGVGITLAAGVLGKHDVHRITGVDFMEDLCKLASDMSSENAGNPVRIGLLGGRGRVAERTGECLTKKYPNLHIVYADNEWKPQSTQEVDILFIAFGFPKQELWMYDHRDKLKVKVMMGVGGAFDYISGEVKRAPKLVRIIGLEWLFRLVVQPWRLTRQMALPKFLLLILKEKFSSK